MRWVRETMLGLVVVALGLGWGRPAAEAAEPDAAPAVARLLSELIRIDSSNPPGETEPVAALLKARFDAAGIEAEIVPTAQRRKAHFIGRLRGDGSKKPVLLAAHADTVGVERALWSVEPFGGEIRNGFVMGRGAIDFKGGVAVFAQAMLEIARKQVPLARDVIFLAEADEEGGPSGARAFSESLWKKIDCEFALNEGGWIFQQNGRVRLVSISTVDKGSVMLTLSVKGDSTHSSLPLPENAIYVLARSLEKISRYDTKPRLTPATRRFFLALAEREGEPFKDEFRTLATSTNPAAVERAAAVIGKDQFFHAILRDTLAPVAVKAGVRANVVPGMAQATLNVRTLPGFNAAELVAELKGVIDDARVVVEISGGNGPLHESPARGELYDALVRHARRVYPEAAVGPCLFHAATDGLAWRQRGIPVYGIYPYPIEASDLERMHGNDERVPVASLQSGLEMIVSTLLEVAAKK